MPKHESVFFAVERPRDKLETLPLHQPDFEAVTVDVSEKIAFILYEGSEVVSVSVRKELPEPSAEALELVVVDDDVRRVACVDDGGFHACPLLWFFRPGALSPADN